VKANTTSNISFSQNKKPEYGSYGTRHGENNWKMEGNYIAVMDHNAMITNVAIECGG